MKKMTNFEKLGLEKKILDVLHDAGFTKPFPIQERTIPVLLEGNDVIGQAHTGTGKTAAFALPMIQLIVKNQGIQGIIMAPTRELALQITSEIKRFAKNTGTKTATIYGGQGMGIQLDALRKKPEIIVLEKLKPLTQNITIKKQNYCRLYDGNIYILYLKKNLKIKCNL